MDISRKVLYNIVMINCGVKYCISAALTIKTERKDDE